MALRSVPTLDGSGEPLEIVLVTREEISFENPAVELNELTDNGITIVANISYANGTRALLTLFEAPYYAPIADFTDEVIDARIVELLTTCSC